MDTQTNYHHPISVPPPSTATPSPVVAPALALFAAILKSVDKLFSVAYLAAGTLQPQLSLVQVNLTCTQQPNSQSYCTSGIYFVHFFHHHPVNKSQTNQCAQWWPQWHQCIHVNGIITYGNCILHWPSHPPNPQKMCFIDLNPLI